VNPVVLIGRWALAFCATAVTLVVTCVGVAYFAGLIHELPKHSSYPLNICFSVAAFAALWVGTSSLPRGQRKTFSIVLWVIWAFIAAVLGDFAYRSGSTGAAAVVILSAAVGERWIRRMLWPKWSDSAGSSDVNPKSEPNPSAEAPVFVASVQIPEIAVPLGRAVRSPSRPAEPPAFGRKR
jgi:hypothetical protein